MKNLNDKEDKFYVMEREIIRKKCLSKKYLKEKYGHDSVKYIKSKNFFYSTKYYVFHLSLFKTPRSIKYLVKLFNLKRDSISESFSNLVDKNILSSVHVDGSDKYFYCNKIKIDKYSLYLKESKKRILDLLELGPLESSKISKILNMNINSLLSLLKRLKDEKKVDYFNSVGNSEGKYYYFLSNNESQKVLAHLLGLGIYDIILYYYLSKNKDDFFKEWITNKKNLYSDFFEKLKLEKSYENSYKFEKYLVFIGNFLRFY